MTWGASVSNRSPISTMGTLDKGQSALAKQLQKMLKGGTQYSEDYLSGLTSFLEGKGPNPFAGPLGKEAKNAMKGAMSGEAPNIFGGAVGNATQQALINAMSGKVSEDYFQNTVAGPAARAFREDIAPTIEKQFVGPGTFWGGAKGEAVQKEGMRLTDAIAAARGGMANEALNRASTTALGYGGMATQAATSAKDRAAQSALGYGQLMSKGVTDWIQAYVAANPSYSDTINSILAYLNTPTQLAFQNPEYIPPAIKEAMKPPPAEPYTGNKWGQMYIGGMYQ